MLDGKNMQGLLDKLHVIDTKIRLLEKVPNATKFEKRIKELDARVKALRDEIILSAMTDAVEGDSGGVSANSVASDND